MSLLVRLADRRSARRYDRIHARTLRRRVTAANARSR